ncbi:MAG TPA: hypothetical protein ENI27_05365 [bacterium]|nr:hypothetical protein [bacterium]
MTKAEKDVYGKYNKWFSAPKEVQKKGWWLPSRPYSVGKIAIALSDWWLSSRPFSVGKIAIALSDFVAFVWLSFIIYQVVTGIEWTALSKSWREVAVMIFVVATAAFVVLVGCATLRRKSDPADG